MVHGPAVTEWQEHDPSADLSGHSQAGLGCSFPGCHNTIAFFRTAPRMCCDALNPS
jgi:hypothetical protein